MQCLVLVFFMSGVGNLWIFWIFFNQSSRYLRKTTEAFAPPPHELRPGFSLHKLNERKQAYLCTP